MGENSREPEETDPPDPSTEPVNDDEKRLLHFIRLLSDDDEINRWKAAEALGRMGNYGGVESLVEALWDDDSRVRLKAAWALGQIGDNRAIVPLRRLYRLEKEEIREIISEALENITRHKN